VLALQVESCSPRLIASRVDACWRPSGFRPGFWPQGQSNKSTPLSRLSHQGSLDHSLEVAPTRRCLAPAHSGARSAPVARLGSGRSPPAGPRIRTPLEAEVQAKAAIQQSCLGPELTPQLAVETVENPKLWNRRRLGFRAARRSDFTTLGTPCDDSNGGRAEKSSERARTSAADRPRWARNRPLSRYTPMRAQLRDPGGPYIPPKPPGNGARRARTDERIARSLRRCWHAVGREFVAADTRCYVRSGVRGATDVDPTAALSSRDLKVAPRALLSSLGNGRVRTRAGVRKDRPGGEPNA
jgi:hypothetical protein